MVKPRHLGDFGNQNNYHLQDLFVTRGAFLYQKLNQVVFDLQLFANFDFEPVVDKDLFDAVCGEILRIAIVRAV